MPRNGSGTYTLPAGNPVQSSTTISSTVQNNTMSDVATALTDSLTADGQKLPTANLPMGGYKHTNVGNATDRNQYAAGGQVQDGDFLWLGTATGTADVITASANPTIEAYVAGQTFRFLSLGANTTNVTLNINGLGAKAVTKNGATALAAGDISSAAVCEVVYDGTQFQLINQTVLPQGGGNLQGAINWKRSTVAATATTTPLWTQPSGNIQDWTGTPTITDFPAAPQAGAQREVYPAAGTVITNAGNISVQGNANYTVVTGDRIVITAITTTTFYASIVRKDGQAVSATSKIQPITASVSSNALTIAIGPTVLDFRSSTASSGTVSTRSIPSSISMTVSSGSTLGTSNATLARIAVIAIDNSGTVEVACMNIAGGANLDETGVISTTAEGGAGTADSALVAYSTTARTSVPYRLMGYIETTQATAGTWASAPSVIQGAGGLAAISTAMNAVGSAPMFACRAWVNFNGAGTVAISGGGNVSSITDLGVGSYAVNFSTALPTANYAYCSTGKSGGGGGTSATCMEQNNGMPPTTTSCAMVAKASATGGLIDPGFISLAIFC
jgi:hypothetical protein